MADTMTNQEIAAEFEELFGGSSEEPEEAPADEPAEEPSETEETPEETTEETAEESSEPEEQPAEQIPETPEDKKQSKQNRAFAEQRLQIKENNEFIKTIGKLIGFDDKASIEEIKEKVKEVLIEKEAKDNNISVDLMKRLDRAEEVLQENQRIKLENKVTGEFSDLIEEYDLSEEDVDAFTQYLIDEGKNPMLSESVDIKAEYLKLHYQDLVNAAVEKALAKEEARKKKVEDKAASGVGKSTSDKSEVKIDSVADLDKLFDGMDL